MNTPRLTKEAAAYILKTTPDSQLIEKTLSLIDSQEGCFALEVGEVIEAEVVERIQETSLIDSWLDALSQRSSFLASFIRGFALSHLGRPQEAKEALDKAVSARPTPDSYLLFIRARLAARCGFNVDAIRDLRNAISLSPSYGFFVKIEKLLDKVISSGDWKPRRQARLALLSSSTTSLLAPVIKAHAFRHDLALEIYEGLYGNYRQEILDDTSGLYRFRPDLVAILLNHRDLALPPNGGLDMALSFCQELKSLWEILRQKNSCHLIQVGFDVPWEGSWGSLEDTLPEGRRRVLRTANSWLIEELPQGMSFLEVNNLVAQAGSEYWSDAEWHSAKQYPASASLPLLANHLVAHCRAALGLTSKVLVLDLDNTLWGGVIGEDLLGGILIGPPNATGEGYLQLQKHFKELPLRGVLLAVCSKNNPADAEQPFREHDAMSLKLEDFVSFKANWQDKASNLGIMAEELSLGLDSFVFLDDNPMERALIRNRLPQVEVPECGSIPWDMLAALERGLFFESVSFTPEDQQRHQSYRSNIARQNLSKESASIDDFLAGLQMVSMFGQVDEKTLPRVTQLINKTNQFNLTTRRYTEEQVRAMAKSPGWWCRWFNLSDQFGEHGLIGVLLARKEDQRWEIDTWLMSCRVLGRKMEEFMCSIMLKEAKQSGAKQVVGQYIPTAKNALVEDLLTRLGFSSEGGEEETMVFDLDQEIIIPDLIQFAAGNNSPSRDSSDKNGA